MENDQSLSQSPRKRSIKRPSAFRDYVTEDKESNTRYADNQEEDENEQHLVGKVQKAYQNLKRIQIVSFYIKFLHYLYFNYFVTWKSFHIFSTFREMELQTFTKLHLNEYIPQWKKDLIQPMVAKNLIIEPS